MRVATFGAGRLGLPHSLLLAAMGYEVCIVDVNPDLVQLIGNGTYETWEPEVVGLLRRYRPAATQDPMEALRGASRADIFVPTPSKPNGEFDPTLVADVFEVVTDAVRRGATSVPFRVVIKSTLWPGQTQMIWESCRQCSSDLVRLYYHPELVALGSVVKEMRSPPMQFLGVHPDQFEEDPIVAASRRRGKTTLHVMSWKEAEMAKLTLNAYLSAKIAFFWDIARMCRSMGIDPLSVVYAVGDDPRIGRWGTQPGNLAEGPCLPRDTEALRALADWLGVGATYAVDAPAMSRLVEIESIMSRLMHAKHVAVLGMSYKPGVPYADASLGTRIVTQLDRMGRSYDAIDFDVPGSCEIHPDKTDAVVLCLPDQRLVDLVHQDFSDCPLILDPWGAL